MDIRIRAAEREKEIVLCAVTCPAGINMPRYLRYLSEGKADEARSVIRERVPLPGVIGRACVRPCAAEAR